jgi:hypothetical protein
MSRKIVLRPAGPNEFGIAFFEEQGWMEVGVSSVDPTGK